ncbi:MAG: flippase-like domain-containing protein [Bacteroidetes bacterium]|nr:flippase-like domain-containing protein [Bacteroidota bacterium]HET6245438.1 lysylphosphatidylglycerol synthase transmembrane domain-containing protein [Bacteroidia bacterium]
MSVRANEILKIFKPRRVIWPILIGLAVATFMVWRGIDLEALVAVSWSWGSSFWLGMAFLMMIIRDLGYMIRINILGDGKIGIRESFDVIMLWEFASAITPSVVGGSAVAVYVVNKEGLNLGKSSAVVLITALMDELFFVLMVPLLYLFIGAENLFPTALITQGYFESLQWIKLLFWISYVIILLYVMIITYALVFKPRGFKWLLLKFFKIPMLRKWRINAQKTGNEIMSASREIRMKPFLYWLKAFAATCFSWTARYWVVNFLILAFIPAIAGLSISDHFVIYGRQLVMWIIMLISPTPGGSGVAEIAFSGFLDEFTFGLAAVIAVIWRLVSYYPYLFIGAIILPKWIKRVYTKHEKLDA